MKKLLLSLLLATAALAQNQPVPVQIKPAFDSSPKRLVDASKTIIVPSGGSITADAGGSIIATGGVASSLPWSGLTAIPAPTFTATGNVTGNFTLSASGVASAVLTVASAPASVLTGTTLASNVVASSLTSVGTLTGGATGAGFTVALSTSTITGTLADARLSANVPLLNSSNVFTGVNSWVAANVTGTGGLGYITMPAQSSPPAAPASQNIRIYADAANKLAWIGASGFTRSFDGTLTASRVYTLQDASGTLAFVGSTVASITGTAGQIVASAATGAVTLSIPSAMTGIVSVAAPTSSDYTITPGGNTKNVVIGNTLNGSKLYLGAGPAADAGGFQPLAWGPGSGFSLNGGRTTFNSVVDNYGGFGYNIAGTAGDITEQIGFEARFQNPPNGVDTENYLAWNGPAGVSPDAGGRTTRRVYQNGVSWGTAYSAPVPMGYANWAFDVNDFSIRNGANAGNSLYIFTGASDGTARTTGFMHWYGGIVTFDGAFAVGGAITQSSNAGSSFAGDAIFNSANLVVSNNTATTITTSLISGGDTAYHANRKATGLEYIQVGAADGGTISGGLANAFFFDIVGDSSGHIRPLYFRSSANTGSTFSNVLGIDPVNGSGIALHSYSTTEATGSTTASMVFDGGVGIVKKLIVAGDSTFTTATFNGVIQAASGTASTNRSTGAIVITGGLGITGNVNVQGTPSFTSASNPFFGVSSAGALSFFDSKSADPATSGSQLKDSGGIDFRGSHWNGSSATTDDAAILNRVASTSVYGLSFKTANTERLYIESTAGNASFSSTTAATSTTVASVTIGGGLGVVGAAYIGGAVRINSALTTYGVEIGTATADDGLRLTGSGVGGPNIYLNATNGTNGNRYSAISYQNNSTAQWSTGIRAGDGLYHIYDVVRSVDAITIAPGASGGVAGTVSIISTTDASSTSTGSLTTAGGLGVAKKAYFGDTVVLGTIQAPASTNLVLNSGSGTRSTVIDSFLTISQSGFVTSSVDYIRDGAVGNRYLKYSTSGSLRWGIGVDATAESGSNAGSNYKFDAFNDAGSYINTWMTISRANGGITLSGSVAPQLAIANTTAGVNAQATFTNNQAGQYSIVRLANSGTGGQTFDLAVGGHTVGGAGQDTFYVYNGTVFAMTIAAGATPTTTLGGAITTAAGTTAAAGAWKLGALRTGVALAASTTQGIQLDVGGTLYTLAVLSTNP